MIGMREIEGGERIEKVRKVKEIKNMHNLPGTLSVCNGVCGGGGDCQEKIDISAIEGGKSILK